MARLREVEPSQDAQNEQMLKFIKEIRQQGWPKQGYVELYSQCGIKIKFIRL